MKPSLGDLVRLHLTSLDALSIAALVAGVLAVAAAGAGAYALIRAVRHGRAGREPSRGLALRRMIGSATALGLVTCVLAVADLAFHQWSMHRILETLGANVTPADVSAALTEGYIGLAFGLVLGAIGLAGGWILEWFADGLESSEGMS